MLKADRDHSLLEAIAQRHDEAAFEALLESHQRAAFGLALAITGRVDRAEEAVQEAMLKVWRAAGTFRPRAGTTVRSWILRVVAREGLILRRKGRSKGSMTREELDCFLSGGPYLEASAALEKREALQNLRAALLELPASDRQLIALAFGAGMSHREIGKDLAIPSRTISRRLQEVLNSLRATLKGSGFPAVLGSAGTENLFEALILRCECPPGLAKRVLERIAAEGTAAAPNHSQPVAMEKKTSPVWRTPLLLGVGMAAAVAAFLTGRAPQPTHSRLAFPAVSAPVTPGRESVHLIWDFRKGPERKGLEMVKGALEWRKGGQGTPGYMEVAPNRLGLWLYPELPADRPYVETLNWRLVRRGQFELGGGWFDGKGRLTRRNIFTLSDRRADAEEGTFTKSDMQPARRYQSRYYTIDQFELVELGGEIVLMSEYIQAPSGAMRRYQSGQSLALESIELRSLDDLELEEWRSRIKGYLLKHPRPSAWSAESEREANCLWKKFRQP